MTRRRVRCRRNCLNGRILVCQNPTGTGWENLEDAMEYFDTYEGRVVMQRHILPYIQTEPAKAIAALPYDWDEDGPPREIHLSMCDRWGDLSDPLYDVWVKW